MLSRRCTVGETATVSPAAARRRYVPPSTTPTLAPLQDVVRLLLFVNISEFSDIEARAPGIVASASDLLPEILIAATQPPGGAAARLDHSVQWYDLRQAVQAEGVRRGPAGGSGRPNPRCAPAARLCPSYLWL